MSKKDEPAGEVDAETFDELAADGEIVDVVADPEPGESQVPGNFEDSTPGFDGASQEKQEVSSEEGEPFSEEEFPVSKHLGPYDESVDMDIIEANKDAYKEAAEAAAKANSEA